MSDPVTNVEIEDVLSSIRKLVSQGDDARVRDSAPAVPEEPAAETTEPEAESKPGKLVLTPAFLVSGGDEPVAQAANIAEPEQTGDAEDTAPQSIAQSAEEIDPAPMAEDVPQDSDAQVAQIVWTDEADETPWDAINTGSTFEAETEVADEKPVSENPVPDKAPAQAEQPEGRRSSLEAAIAELEASVEGDEFEPDGSEAPEEVDSVVWPSRAASAVPEIEDAEEVDAPAAEAPEPEATTAHPVEDADVAYENAEIETADAGISPDADAELEALLAGGSSVDEDALRDLVTEIVREELQGPMGERITRNVRKLVRREIYRILSSQDFE